MGRKNGHDNAIKKNRERNSILLNYFLFQPTTIKATKGVNKTLQEFWHPSNRIKNMHLLAIYNVWKMG